MPELERIARFARRIALKGTRQLLTDPVGGVRKVVALATGKQGTGGETSMRVKDYWTEHNVSNHRKFGSREESIAYFDWRNGQYLDYIDLMPVRGRDGEVVIDYGCGPGHDLVGFAEYGKAKQIYGIDVSTSSIAEARDRLKFHDGPVELIVADPQHPVLPFEDGSIDYIHSSGVLHHIPDPAPIVREFRRVLKPTGKGRLMLYWRESIWYHLYVAYHLRRLNGAYKGFSQTDAFTASTDGPDCPVARSYTFEAASKLLGDAGLSCRFVGASISAFEMSLLPSRFQAIMDERVEREHREFLSTLTFNARGLPLHGSTIAGIDGVFEFSHLS